jgi:hypothetical protein
MQEKERVRLTVGGDILDYPSDVATSTSDITTFKTLINSTLIVLLFMTLLKLWDSSSSLVM